MVDQGINKGPRDDKIIHPPKRTLGDYVIHQGPRYFYRFVIPLIFREVEIKPTFLNPVLAYIF